MTIWLYCVFTKLKAVILHVIVIRGMEGQHCQALFMVSSDFNPFLVIVVSWIWYQIIWWWGSSLGDLGIWSNASLLLFPGSLWPGVVATDRALSMGETEKLCANKWLMLNCGCYIAILGIIYLCVKRSSGLFKNVIYKMYLQIIYIYINK